MANKFYSNSNTTWQNKTHLILAASFSPLTHPHLSSSCLIFTQMLRIVCMSLHLQPCLFTCTTLFLLLPHSTIKSLNVSLSPRLHSTWCWTHSEDLIRCSWLLNANYFIVPGKQSEETDIAMRTLNFASENKVCLCCSITVAKRWLSAHI